MRRLTLIGIFLGALLLASPAAASEIIARNASNVVLKVDNQGRALLSYTERGVRRNALAWGAVNARHPSRTVPQVKFRVDYSGGWATHRKPVWKTFRNRCRAYDGPKLPWRVTACKAPDGSYWAVQSFKRLLPNLGMNPWLPKHRARELHLSHWKGPIARLDVHTDWVYGNQAHEVFGRLTYRGQGVHGFSSTSAGAPLDGYGRLIFLDVYNAENRIFRRGWIRENSFLARRTTGIWCYHFVSRKRYAGYPVGPRRPAAHGERYRITAGGPGVTPFVMKIVDGLPHYNGTEAHVALERAMEELRAVYAAGEQKCVVS